MPTDFRAKLLIADFIAADSAGKLTSVGTDWAIAGVDPKTGQTAPFSVAALIDVPATRIGQDFPVTLELRSADGQQVRVTGITGTDEALRVSQMLRAERIQIPGLHLPDGMWSRVQQIIAFANGIPLTAGQSYFWRLEVDGQHLRAWEQHFHIAGPPPPPAFGGPANPANIPNVSMPVTDEDE